MAIDIGLGISIAGLLLSLTSLYLVRRDRNTTVITANENRITTLEKDVGTLQDQVPSFTEDDRACLQKVDMRMDLFWTVVEKEFPKLLVQQHTPKLDVLLEKASLFGIKTFSMKEKRDLSTMLDDEIDKARETEDSGRAVGLALYRATVEYELRGGNTTC